MFDLKAYLDEKRKIVDEVLSVMLADSTDTGAITTVMRYAVMAGGKRIRPVLCMSAAEAIREHAGSRSDVLRTSCAIEMIHTYSLIHDDLPAMDNDDLRRGKSTCHIRFGEASAILAGDALLTLALEVMSDIEPMDNGQIDNEPMDIERMAVRLRAMNIVTRASGRRGMIEGQLRDMDAEGRRLSLDDLENMHAFKTGSLIGASVQSGAILAGADDEQLEKLRQYAGKIGLAFQVTDDILNVVGDPELMGKAVGTDKDRGKNTYPNLLGLKKSREFAQKLVNDALEAIEAFGNRSDPLGAIARYIVERKR